MEDFSLHVDNFFSNNAPNIQAHRAALKNSKRAIRLGTSKGILSSAGLKRKGFENNLIETQYIDRSHSRRKKRATGRKPPPPPSNLNIFPIHTPPSTPCKSIASSSHYKFTKQDANPSQANFFPFGGDGATSMSKQTVEKGVNLLNELIQFDNPDPQFSIFQDAPLSLEPMNPGPDVDLIGHNKIEIFGEPDYSKVEEICGRYYPHIVKLNSPSTIKINRCTGLNCTNYNGPWYQCTTCIAAKWYCKECIVLSHVNNPFHRVEEWNLDKVVCNPVSLEQLGLVVRFNSTDGQDCHCQGKDENTRTLEVIHTNGIHKIRYHLCSCHNYRKMAKTATPEQLITNRLFPATNTFPNRAFTFELLGEYDLLNLFGFINIKQFLDSKLNMTTYDTPTPEQSSGRMRDDFHDAVRYWRLFRVMQASGFIDHAELAKNGVVESCPACPLPGINLPADWETHKYKDLLFSVFYSGDGNFHLQSKLRSKELVEDPSVFGDAGFFSPHKVYQNYVREAQQFKPRKKAGTCGTQAGNSSRDRPNERFCKGGVFAIQCKHGLYQANGVADFPKGERFDIVDVPFQTQLQKAYESGLQHVVWLYDVNCKFKVNSWERCVNNPYSPLSPAYQDRLKSQEHLRYFINVWHGYSHKPECADKHSLRNANNVGMVTGEEIESGWARLNHLQYPTREMDAGARVDAITIHMLQSNADKTRAMGGRLLNRLEEALAQWQSHSNELQELECTLDTLDPTIIPRYRDVYSSRGGDQFRPDHTKFAYPTRSSQMEMLKQFQLENPLSQIIQLANLANEGIDMEDERFSKKNNTTQLDNQIYHFNQEVLSLFPSLQKQGSKAGTVILPSSCGQVAGMEFHQWAKAELQIRVGIGHDLLQELRVSAGLHSYYVRRQQHSRGRAQMERVAKSQDSASKKKSMIISKYIRNWQHISQIFKSDNRLNEQKVELLKGLQQLNKNEDVKFFEEWGSQTSDYMGFSQLNVSWIWRVAMEGQPSTVSVEKSEMKLLTDSWESEARRLHWLHCFTRNERWKEEVILVAEEIRRIGAWYRYQLMQAKEAVNAAGQLNESWLHRGIKSMLNKKVIRIEREYMLLPPISKVESIGTYDGVLASYQLET